mmetsp:Transcript_39093/g.98276  ORF Transcript_39093/g.98276 Transcript_39093/m.98276 type:complete len:208 (-) Transcript_39093:538-1161(-)
MAHGVLYADRVAATMAYPQAGPLHGSLMMLYVRRYLSLLLDLHWERILDLKLLHDGVKLAVDLVHVELQVHYRRCGGTTHKVGELVHEVVNVDQVLALVAELLNKPEDAVLVDDDADARQLHEHFLVAPHGCLQVLGLHVVVVILLVLANVFEELPEFKGEVLFLLIHGLLPSLTVLLLRGDQALADNPSDEAQHRVRCHHDVEHER